ncbi:hypothetical protein WA026_012161, partial [Henosepilachna vigintioctopunctata]
NCQISFVQPVRSHCPSRPYGLQWIKYLVAECNLILDVTVRCEDKRVTAKDRSALRTEIIKNLCAKC